jgi:hypothetical protein
MWLFLNDSFLSIVAHRDKPGVLLVRARQAGDIEAVFPDAKTWVDENADYPHRAEVVAEAVAQAVAERARGISYDNFKNSVRERGRHDAYMRVWDAMWRWGHAARGNSAG